MGGDDSVWRALHRKMTEAGIENAHVKVGVLAAAGAESAGAGITMVELAAIHEFGSPAAGIPERSYIRFTMLAKGDELRTKCTALAVLLVNEQMTFDRALGLLGTWASTEIRKSITERKIKQELRPATIARKNRTSKDATDQTTALVDTGRLLNAITWEVNLGSGLAVGAP